MEPMHYTLRDNVLSKIVEVVLEVVIAAQLINFFTLIIDIDLLVLIVVEKFIGLLKYCQDINDDLNEFSQIFQVLFLDGFLNRLDLLFEFIPFEDVELGQVFLVIGLQVFEITKEVFKNSLLLYQLFLH